MKNFNLEVKFNYNLIIKKIIAKMPERCIRRASIDTDQRKRRNSYFQSDYQMQI